MRRSRASRAHKFTLYNPRQPRVASQVIEVRTDVGEVLLLRRQIQFQHVEDALCETCENMVQHRAVERFFVFEVVVEQRFIDRGRPGYGVGAGAGHAFLCELAHGRIENGGPGLLGLAASTEAGLAAGFTGQRGQGILLINQLVIC